MISFTLYQELEFVDCISALVSRGRDLTALWAISRVFENDKCEQWFSTFRNLETQPYDGPIQWRRTLHQMTDALFRDVEADPKFIARLHEALVPEVDESSRFVAIRTDNGYWRENCAGYSLTPYGAGKYDRDFGEHVISGLGPEKRAQLIDWSEVERFRGML